MLFDIHRLCWDEKLAAELEIPLCMLPEVRPQHDRRAAAARQEKLGKGGRQKPSVGEFVILHIIQPVVEWKMREK